MTKKILYSQQDSSIAMMSISSDITIEDAIKDIPSAAEKIIVEDSQLPNEEDLKYFFNALTVDFQDITISINIQKAREITKNRLRKERIAYFEKNDLALRDAMLENNQEKINLAIAERDRLRNITDLVDSISDLDGLKNIHP
jgi:ACT domain-containing protein